MLNRKINGWAVLSLAITAAILLPHFDILLRLFQPPNAIWHHIREYLLADYLLSTGLVVGGTVLAALCLGASLAWLVCAFDFPGRSLLRWALVLPLAIPPYIGAYTYAGMVSYTGSIQVSLRRMGLNLPPALFDIMSLPGTVFIFTLFLFPYVYMVMRSYLERQSAGVIESARLLGSSWSSLFLRVVLPMSRSVLVAGGSLVALEVLSDYGVVSYYGVNTFSSAIFKSWISFGDVSSAIRLAALLMVCVLLVLTLEKVLRGRRRYSFATTKVRPLARQQLHGPLALLASGYVFLIFALSFLIPIIQMVYWGVRSYTRISYRDFAQMIGNSLFLAAGCSLLILCASLILANYARLFPSPLSRFCAKVSLMGYSIPGAVVAITMLLFFLKLDRQFGLQLSTSLVLLIFAYLVRFLAVGYQSIEGGYEKIGSQFTEASRTLGANLTQTFFRVDLPMLKPAILTAFALSFVDIMKELPLVLNLRPFNFHTLSTKVFDYANDEMIPEAAVPSLVIILISVLAIFSLHHFADQEDSP